MKPEIFMVVGVPGSGKTWVCAHLVDKFNYIHHDLYISKQLPKGAYVRAIMEAAKTSEKPLLIEAPFSISEIKDPLEYAGFKVTPLVIVEDVSVLKSRYEGRDKKPIPQGHITRMKTYADRAREFGWFSGASEEVLSKLRSL